MTWGIAWTILRFAWPYLLTAVVLGTGYYELEGYCNHACVDQRTRADTLQTQKDAAQKRATDLALLWSRQVDITEQEARNAQTKIAADYAAQQDNVRHLSSLPTLKLSADAWRVLDSATDFANAAPASPIRQISPQAVSEAAIGQYALDAADAYRDAYTHWQSCVNFYEGLSHVQAQ